MTYKTFQQMDREHQRASKDLTDSREQMNSIIHDRDHYKGRALRSQAAVEFERMGKELEDIGRPRAGLDQGSRGTPVAPAAKPSDAMNRFLRRETEEES